MTIRLRNLALGSCAALLAACQTAVPIVEAPSEPQCPAPIAVECPVCEVLSCPEQTPAPIPEMKCPAVPKLSCPAQNSETRYQVIGATEWALVEPGDIILEARIDTGAETSSIHAENIQLVEKDSKRWVRFTVMDSLEGREVELERRLHRRVLIKQTGSDELERRYVVRMWVTIGKTRTWLDVSLSDRDDFEFPLLIGRNMLTDAFAVDVSQHHTQPKPKPTAAAVVPGAGSNR
ncbi:MAG: RimK/LysX family protein [Congregibacter sp.]|nr:RimK/LysX family protein [Congregibacter sp.]